MQYSIKMAALLMACSLTTVSAFAQSGKRSITKDETVIIKKDKGNGRTVVEIKDGTVYVNGDPIVTVHDADAAKVHKKVIIEDATGGEVPGLNFFNYDDNADNDRSSGKAMLGVLTDPKSERRGAMVKDVTPGSPAEKAGLRSGDVITSIDGATIKDAGALVNEIAGLHKPGDNVGITYLRNGRERSTNAKLDAAGPRTAMRSFHFGPGGNDGDMPNMMMRSFPFTAGDDMAPSPKLGVSAEDRADGDGVRVLDVKPGSPAEAAGIREGDVITRIGDDKLSSVDELQMNLRSHKGGDRVQLEYERNGQRATTNVSLPKSVKRKDL